MVGGSLTNDRFGVLHYNFIDLLYLRRYSFIASDLSAFLLFFLGVSWVKILFTYAEVSWFSLAIDNGSFNFSSRLLSSVVALGV